MAIKKEFTCASCGTECDIARLIIPTNPILLWNRYFPYQICEGCFNDGVLDDININGDMASVNTSGVY